MMFSSKTFQMDLENHRLRGLTDRLNAVRQAVMVMLSVPRFQHEIFTRNFGHDLLELNGKPSAYVLGELRRMIAEALLIDERISEIGNFAIEKAGENLKVSFRVSSVYGDFDVERSVVLSEQKL